MASHEHEHSNIAVTANGPLVGESPALLSVLSRARRAAATNIPVLLGGESGTGKELLAQFIHQHSSRSQSPLIIVNCASFPRELADAALFGHERGAFTGAREAQPGWFQTAATGTLVLDEIGELPLELQPKLLRVLENGLVTRVGGRRALAVDVRIIAVTNRDLQLESDRGRFRLDLYHRLAGFRLTMPPLRERTSDVPLLLAHFVRQIARQEGHADADAPVYVPPGALERLQAHAWSGNVRELRHLAWRAIAMGGLPVAPETLLAELESTKVCESDPAGAIGRGQSNSDWADAHCAAEVLASDRPFAAFHGRQPPPWGWIDVRNKDWPQIEADVIRYQLAQHAGNRRKVARALGMSRTTLYERLRRLSGQSFPNPGSREAPR